MEFYTAAEGNIDPRDMALFGTIQRVLTAMPNLIFDANEREWGTCKNQVTCHLICRALAVHYKVTTKDGHFFSSYQHSWLVPESGSSIIDAYPVAGATPFIVAKDSASPWTRLYKESNLLQPKFKTDEFRSRLKRTTQEVGETIKKLCLI